MQCPSEKCGSSNVRHLPHYWASLPSDSPQKREYAQPAEVEPRARLVAVGVAVLGLVLAVTGTVALGLALLAAGAIAAFVVHGRITAAAVARGEWQRTQICLACTHLWAP